MNDFSPLRYVDVNIAGLSNQIRGLYDTGAELSVVSSRALPDFEIQRIGNVKLRGIVGAPVEADLIILPIRLAGENQTFSNHDYLQIHCALCDNMNDDLVLTADVVRRLYDLRSRGTPTLTSSNVVDDLDHSTVDIPSDSNNSSDFVDVDNCSFVDQQTQTR